MGNSNGAEPLKFNDYVNLKSDQKAILEDIKNINESLSTIKDEAHNSSQELKEVKGILASMESHQANMISIFTSFTKRLCRVLEIFTIGMILIALVSMGLRELPKFW